MSERLLEPLVPFEPVRTDRIIEGEPWVAQVKWDGVRVLTYYDGNEVRLYNRKKNERTLHYPELTDLASYCKAGSVILDGEVIALDANGKPSFHEVMRRDGIRRMERVDYMRKAVPITYMIFDVIYCDGEWVYDRKLRERMDILSTIILPGDRVQLVTSHPQGKDLFKAVQRQRLEGIVVKDLNSKYLINGKDSRWQKIKNYKDLIAVIGGVTLRDGVVNAVLLGLYDEKGRLWYIGHAGTGKFKREEWRNLTDRVKPLIVAQRPFVNKPERIKGAVWVKPELTVKVQFINWTEGHTLRQPSIQAFVDVPPEECVLTRDITHA